jgi:hypothetical protein
LDLCPPILASQIGDRAVGWATLSILTEIGVTTPGIAIDLLGGGISRSYGDKFGLLKLAKLILISQTYHLAGFNRSLAQRLFYSCEPAQNLTLVYRDEPIQP